MALEITTLAQSAIVFLIHRRLSLQVYCMGPTSPVAALILASHNFCYSFYQQYPQLEVISAFTPRSFLFWCTLKYICIWLSNGCQIGFFKIQNASQINTSLISNLKTVIIDLKSNLVNRFAEENWIIRRNLDAKLKFPWQISNTFKWSEWKERQ